MGVAWRTGCAYLNIKRQEHQSAVRYLFLLQTPLNPNVLSKTVVIVFLGCTNTILLDLIGFLFSCCSLDVHLSPWMVLPLIATHPKPDEVCACTLATYSNHLNQNLEDDFYIQTLKMSTVTQLQLIS